MDRVDEKAVVFRVGDGRYALPLEWIHAVQWESGDGQSGGGEDRISYRGGDLPLFSVADWFGNEKTGTETPTLLMVGKEKVIAAARVDSPGKVVAVGEVRKLPRLCRGMVKGVFRGVMVGDEDMVLMIDPEGLMREVERKGDRGSQGGERR